MQKLKDVEIRRPWYHKPLNPNETSIRSIIGPPITVPCRLYDFKKEVPAEECLECGHLYSGFGCLEKDPFEHKTKKGTATPEKLKSGLV